MTHRALALGSRSTGRPLSEYSPEAAVSPDPDPSYAPTSSAHRKARPSIFHIKRDTTGLELDSLFLSNPVETRRYIFSCLNGKVNADLNNETKAQCRASLTRMEAIPERIKIPVCCPNYCQYILVLSINDV